MTDADPAVRTHVQDNGEAWLSRLVEWLRIPSIGGDPAHAPDVMRSARWLMDELTAHGFPTVELWETPGMPSVFAEWPSGDPGATTVLVYGHHDVQPVDPLELWTTPPFEPTRDGDVLRGRGASDDKSNVLMHLLGLSAHLATTGRTSPAVNLKVLVEGEEESGSPHFGALLRERRSRLDCDVVVVSDTGMWSADVPTICVGMRGMTDGQVDFHGPDGDLHSGSFGGAVPNPVTELARVLGRLHDADGHVTIPGFYDGVVVLGAARARAARPAAVRRGGVPGRRAVACPLGRGRLLDAGAHLGPPDRGGQRLLGWLHRPRPQDDRAVRRARQGLLPAGDRPGAGPHPGAVPRLAGRPGARGRSAGTSSSTAPAYARA